MLDTSSYSQRQSRAAEVIKAALIDVLKKGKGLDFRLFEAKITVSEVKISPDLKVANCFVLNFPGSKLSEKDLIDALESSRNSIRHMVSSAVQLKYSTELRFKYDNSFDRLDQIEKFLLKA